MCTSRIIASGEANRKTDHWAYRPLVQPPIPLITDVTWVRTPVDAFILAKLNEQNFTPNPLADRRTLIRRVSFDLTGLPPTPEEVSAFIADASPDAYEKLVDRLLASPAYGERWARHWLDVAHYGESHGFGMDRPRPNAWPYRDYVIRSFNEDKPYARFVEEQVAGDVLYPDDPQATVALGFIAAGPWNQSPLAEQTDNTACKRSAQNLDRDDMLMTTMSTFVSTTVHCARCHDHKFDPVSIREYYALQSVFAAVDKAERPFDADPKVHALRHKLLRQKLALDTGVVPDGLDMPAVPSDGEVEAWAGGLAGDESKWQVLTPGVAYADSGASAKALPDGSVLYAATPRPETDGYAIVAHTQLREITAVRLEVLTDPSLPNNGPGRADNGNFALSEFRVLAGPARDELPLQRLAIARTTADTEEADWPASAATDDNDKTAWGVHPRAGSKHVAVFALATPLTGHDGGTTLRFRLIQKNPKGHLIGRPRISVTCDSKESSIKTLPAGVWAILDVPAIQRTGAQRAELATYIRLDRLNEQLAALPPPTMIYAATNDFKPYANFKPARLPRPIHVLRRGEIDQFVEAATPGALSFVPGLPATFTLHNPNDEGARRAALAKWLSDPRNVLTWRSIVNRVWHYHFGRGIVDTPNDFGLMGAPPSHPEMLDWLAVWFRDDAHGSIKALHRLIVTSSVYMQTSTHNEAYARVDAGNQFLWRMNRSRLDAECVRDGILQMAGLLDLKMGGPSVKQSVFTDPSVALTPKADYANFDVDSPESRRRSIYRYIFRTLPDPFMDSMDCADASQLTAKRNVSVTPLQALAMLNNRFVVRYAEHLASRIAPAGDASAQLAKAYELTMNRRPTADETAELSEYASKYGMANACRVILNCNEFLFVD